MRRTRERGAALMEFALLTPLLLLLILGIVEFGWIFGQFNDIRHSAREGARYAAVNGGTEAEIATRVCESVEGFGAGLDTLTVDLVDGTTQPDGEAYLGAIGDMASITVTAELSHLTGVPVITVFLPSSLTSDVDFRLERNSELWGSSAAIDAGALC